MYVAGEVIVCLIWVNRAKSSLELADPFLEAMYIRGRIRWICATRFRPSTIGASWSCVVALDPIVHQFWLLIGLDICTPSAVYFCIVDKRLPLWNVSLVGLFPSGRGRL